MEQFGNFILFAASMGLIWFFYYQYKRKSNTTPTTAESCIEEVPTLSTDPTKRTLLTSTLRKLNIEYELDRDNDFIITYHGEKILLFVRDDDSMLHMKDFFWYSAPLDDIENLSILHKAINECNTRCLNTLVYEYDNKENEINVHSTRDLLWIPQIPDIDKYLREALDDMLKMHNYLFRWLEEIRREKHSQTK